MSDNEFHATYRVYIEDTDAGGVVYYVNYLKFMERGRSDFMRSLGFPKAALINDELAIVVSSAKVDYRMSAVLDDQLIISVAPIKLAKSHFIFRQCALRESSDGRLERLAEAEIKVACVNRQSGRPTRFPENLTSAVQHYFGESTL